MPNPTKKQELADLRQSLVDNGQVACLEILPEVFEFVATCEVCGGLHHARIIQNGNYKSSKSLKHLLHMVRQNLPKPLIYRCGRYAGIWVDLYCLAHTQNHVSQYFPADLGDRFVQWLQSYDLPEEEEEEEEEE